MIWDVDPTLFSIGPFSLKWYGLWFAAGFFVGYHFMRRVYLDEEKSLKDLDALLVYMMVGTVVGADRIPC